MGTDSVSSLEDVVAVEVSGVERKNHLVTLNFASNVREGQLIVARQFNAHDIVNDTSLSWEGRLERLTEWLVYDGSDSGLRHLSGDFVLAPSGAGYVAPLKLCLSGGVKGRSLKSHLPRELQPYLLRPADVVRVVRDLCSAVVGVTDYFVTQNYGKFSYALPEKDAVFLAREVFYALSGADRRVVDDIFPDRYPGEVSSRNLERFRGIALDILSLSESETGKVYYAYHDKSIFEVKLAETMALITSLSRLVPVELFDLLRCENVIGNGINYVKAAARASDNKQRLNDREKGEFEHAVSLLQSAKREKEGLVAWLGVMAEGYGSWGPITNIPQIIGTLKSYGLLAAPVSSTII